jgi:glutathione S-transferase
MAGDKLVLFGETNWTSPYVYSCFVALKEKGLDFEMKLLSLAGDEHRR